ncbi:MAG: glycosyltransferase [Xenococcus sp. (in: cyanobacteria)]
MNHNQFHVAFYLRMLSGGGAERVFINLIQGFIARGIKVDLVLNIAEGAYLPQVPAKARVIELKTPNLLKGLPRLAKYLKKEKPDTLISALHFNNEIAIWAKLLAGVKTRVVVSEHNTLSVRSKHQTDREKWAPLFARFFYPWANEIVTVSHGAAADLSQVTGLPLSRIKVIYNPVITPELLEQAKEPVEHPWFADGEPPVILAVGRLHKQKDYSTLIRAFAKVRQNKPCRLMILGTGPDRQKLQSLIKELDLESDVLLSGFKANPYAYMSKASMLVLSSQWEGLPTVLIEALAIGIPVIATDCQSGPNEILDNGKYGDLVPVGDSNMMAEKILEVLSGNYKFVDSTWLNQFGLEKATNEYIELIKR